MLFKASLLLTTYATVWCMQFSDIISKCDYKPLDKFLNCENVKIGNLEKITLPEEPAILHFYLQTTGLTIIQPDAFVNFPQLLLIDLRNNLLTNLDYNVFSMLNELRSLFLFGNKLTSLNDNRIFASQRNLIYLNLDNNMLTTLAVDVLEPMTSLSQLHLDGNPFICSSEMNLTIQWCRMRTSRCTIGCKNAVPRSDMGKEHVTLPEDLTPVTVTTVIKEGNQHEYVYNLTHKVVINNHSDGFHYQTILIVISLLCIIVALLCFGFGAFLFYRRRGRNVSKPANTNVISRVGLWRYHARNENEYSRNYLSVIPDLPERPHALVPQKQYDDVLNVVKEEAEYVSYITPDSS